MQPHLSLAFLRILLLRKRIGATGLLLLATIAAFTQQVTPGPISVTIRLDAAQVRNLGKNTPGMRAQIRATNAYVPTDSVRQRLFDITVTLKNITDTTVAITLMNCSWEDNFIVNNNHMRIEGSECDHNFPQRVSFHPGESRTYQARLRQSIGIEYPCKGCTPFPPVPATKLGLIILDGRGDAFDYFAALEDKSAWTLSWSNPLYLLTDEQANPKPKVFDIIEMKKKHGPKSVPR